MLCIRTPPPQILNIKRVPKPNVPYTPPSTHGNGQNGKNLLTINSRNISNQTNSTAMQPQANAENKIGQIPVVF